MCAAIKPEIYISWIPRGQVCFKPQIFASCIPAPAEAAVEKVSADLIRNVSTSESFNADSFRQISQKENSSADLLRSVVASEKNCTDTNRKITAQEFISSDTFRRVEQNLLSFADSFRRVTDTQKVIADTSRNSGLAFSNADLLRIIFVTTKNNFDTCRYLGEAQKISADIYLKTELTEFANADTYRALTFSTNGIADALRKIGVMEKVSAHVTRFIGSTFNFSADTLLKIVMPEKIIGNLCLAFCEFFHADVFRKIVRVEKTPADTIIRVPHVLNYIVTPRLLTKKKFSVAESPSLVNTFKDYGVTSINITLNEKTLSDDFRLETCRQMEINDAVQGSLLDYHFNFLVEETSQTELVQTVKGRYNQDDLLYTWFYLTSDSQNPYPKAQEIITRIANYFCLASDIRIDDFATDNLSYDTTITYSDLLNSLFGWTSRVPQRQINIFIRGGVLHCIQRGKESSVFDITNLPHSRPAVNKKFIRVLCHNPNNDDNDDADDEYKFSGTISYSNNGDAPFFPKIYLAYTYSAGLLIKEQISTQTGFFSDGEDLVMLSNYSSTNYFYTSFLNRNSGDVDHYISEKENEITTRETRLSGNGIEHLITTQKTSTNYGYQYNDKEIYLFHEGEQTSRKETSGTETESESELRDTYHAPLGNGWYAQTVYKNGILQGANLSQGKPGNAVSPYTVKRVQQNFKNFDINYTPPENEENELSAIVDDSFPVRESETKKKLNDALRWLHRKIEETISLDLISPVENGIPKINHIVDFTERIRFNGNDYFLISNHISFTPRKFIQKLQLVRWY